MNARCDLDSVRCPSCAEFSARLKKSLTESEKDQLLHAQSQHIATVRDYRLTQMRYANLSEEPDSGIMKIDVDFCDQAKFRVPGTQHPAKQQNHCGDRSCTWEDVWSGGWPSFISEGCQVQHQSRCPYLAS